MPPSSGQLQPTGNETTLFKMSPGPKRFQFMRVGKITKRTNHNLIKPNWCEAPSVRVLCGVLDRRGWDMRRWGWLEGGGGSRVIVGGKSVGFRESNLYSATVSNIVFVLFFVVVVYFLNNTLIYMMDLGRHSGYS